MAVGSYDESKTLMIIKSVFRVDLTDPLSSKDSRFRVKSPGISPVAAGVISTYEGLPCTKLTQGSSDPAF